MADNLPVHPRLGGWLGILQHRVWLAGSCDEAGGGGDASGFPGGGCWSCSLMPAVAQRIPVAEGVKLRRVYRGATAAGLSLQRGKQNSFRAFRRMCAALVNRMERVRAGKTGLGETVGE